jgi:2,3-bisphosphoglycerate-dependent phosphoglycerate mutase
VSNAETRLVLIRHAESVINRDHILGGHRTCTGLSETGRVQAGALRDRLLATGELADATMLLTSVLPRSVETASIIAPAVGSGRLKPLSSCDLCEVHWGEADGTHADELPITTSIYQPVAPGGESWIVFMRRCRRVLVGLARQHPGNTVVAVTHSGVIKSSIQAFAKGAEHYRGEFAIAYTAMTVWGVDWEGLAWRLVTFNDHAHLHAGRSCPISRDSR